MGGWGGWGDEEEDEEEGWGRVDVRVAHTPSALEVSDDVAWHLEEEEEEEENHDSSTRRAGHHCGNECQCVCHCATVCPRTNVRSIDRHTWQRCCCEKKSGTGPSTHTI